MTVSSPGCTPVDQPARRSGREKETTLSAIDRQPFLRCRGAQVKTQSGDGKALLGAYMAEAEKMLAKDIADNMAIGKVMAPARD